MIGKEGDSRLRIERYRGKDIANHDTMETTGGSLGLQAGNVPLSNIGYSQDSRDKEGISRNTIIGDVEIGTSIGDPINTDLSKSNEVTRDERSSTDINVESQTIGYAINPAKFKEDLEVAIVEGKATVQGVIDKINNVLTGSNDSDIAEAERRSFEEIKGYLITAKTNPAIQKIIEEDLTKELQEELRIGGKFNPDDPNLPQKVKDRIEEARQKGYEIPYFYDKVTGNIYINENADSEEVRAGIAREWAIRNELEAERGKPNADGQDKATVSGIIAYNEVRDRTKGKDKGIDISGLEYGEFDPDSEITSDGRLFQSQLRDEKIKEIRDKKYGISDKKLHDTLKVISMTKDTNISSIYFGFYFLPKDVQEKYLMTDEDGKKGLRIDLFDPNGYKKLENSKEYTVAMYRVNIKVFEKTLDKLKNNDLKSVNFDNNSTTQKFYRRRKIRNKGNYY